MNNFPARLFRALIFCAAIFIGSEKARAQTNVATITTGPAPAAIAINPVTNKIYVANSGGNNVAILDGATLSLSGTVPSGAHPQAIAVNAITNKIYVANKNSGSVTVIDGATNATSTINVGASPSAIVLDSATNKIYVATSSTTVAVIDGATNATQNVALSASGSLIAVNPTTNQIYIPATNSGLLTDIDGGSQTTSTLNYGTGPAAALALNPITNRIYVANNGTNSVTVIDLSASPASFTLVATGSAPSAFALNPNTGNVYTADKNGNSVTLINAANSPTTIPVGLSPGAIAADAGANKIYVANSGDNTVNVIDGASAAVTGTISVGANPQAIAVNPITGKIFVANSGTNTVSVIDGAANNAPAAQNFLSTNIVELPGDITYSSNVAFDFNALSTFLPSAPPVQQIFWQLDTTSGAWQSANRPGANATAFVGALQSGTHVLFAFAADAQASSIGNTSPVTGKIASYSFSYRTKFFSGTYTGEIGGSDAAHSGVFLLKTLSTGAFTGSMSYGGKSYSLKGRFNSIGEFQTTIARSGTSPLLVNFSVQLVDGIDTIVGTVFDGTATSAIDAEKISTGVGGSGFAGKYTVVIPPDPLQATGSSAPQGTGIGTLNVLSNGHLTFAGTLADGTPFSQSATVSASGKWFLSLGLYASSGPKRGVLKGTIQFASHVTSDLSGNVIWLKPANAGATFYPNGFTLSTRLSGAKYNAQGVPPGRFILATTGTAISTTGTFSASGANLAMPVSEIFARAFVRGKIITAAGSKALSVKINETNGVITGSFESEIVTSGTNTVTQKLPLHAVIVQEPLQNTSSAAGSFFSRRANDNESGPITFQQSP